MGRMGSFLHTTGRLGCEAALNACNFAEKDATLQTVERGIWSWQRVQVDEMHQPAHLDQGRSHCWVGPFDLSYCCTFYASDARLLPHVPCWRDADGPKRRVQFELAGREWTLWQKPREPSDTRGVMAHVMWPSAYALAAWVLDKTGTATDAIEATHVLELGCGLALPSLAAALGGAAKAQGTDIDRD
ncbi:unnamed protein product [Symbiodinium microadriaticum]|nr:unnamed protein product [Symbiodinium microadriaticum]